MKTKHLVTLLLVVALIAALWGILQVDFVAVLKRLHGG